MSDAARPTPDPHAAKPEPAGWQNRRRARPLSRKTASGKPRPWLHLLSDADQADGFEYHNPLVSIFYPQEGL